MRVGRIACAGHAADLPVRVLATIETKTPRTTPVTRRIGDLPVRVRTTIDLEVLANYQARIEIVRTRCEDLPGEERRRLRLRGRSEGDPMTMFSDRPSATRSMPVPRRRRALVIASLAVIVALALAPAAQAAGPKPPAPPDFGPNVLIFDPGMPQADIQAAVDAVANQQVSNQFGPQRYALLFKPGTYGSEANPLNFQVGYYTAVAGLGRSPG